MKKIYWHTHNLPRIYILTLCLFTIVGMVIVEHFKQFVPVEYYHLKIDSAHTARDAFKAAKALREQKNIPINEKNDPQKSGLIGDRFTDITSDSGDLITKQTTVNPNIVAIFINWLEQLNLKAGDTVAVGATGSFPALDISMLAAIKAMKLNPLIIYSGAASQFGANIPKFTILDIQHDLHTRKILNYTPIAASIGGGEDRGTNITEKGRTILQKTIEDYGYPLIEPTGTTDSINQRITLYNEASQDQPIKAYINIGGGMASIGLKQLNEKTIKETARPPSLPTGVLTSMPIIYANTDSVAVRFLKKGIPVVNVHNIGKKLRDQYKLPVNAQYSPIGWGPLFFHETYNKFLTAVILGIIIIVIVTMAIVSRKYRIRYIPPR
ncbi:MAG: hypothetical protein CL816_06925 [Coxiellaceae bacterium]|nr:hypothetical protein [Coxiellaceae bacterium]